MKQIIHGEFVVSDILPDTTELVCHLAEDLRPLAGLSNLKIYK